MYEALCSWENLIRAYRRASKGKRGRSDVAEFEHHLEDNLAGLREELTSGVYRPAGYSCFYIHEPKRRLISAADFRDRVVHHALCLQVEPLFERSFWIQQQAGVPAVRFLRGGVEMRRSVRPRCFRVRRTRPSAIRLSRSCATGGRSVSRHTRSRRSR